MWTADAPADLIMAIILWHVVQIAVWSLNDQAFAVGLCGAQRGNFCNAALAGDDSCEHGFESVRGLMVGALAMGQCQSGPSMGLKPKA